MLIWVNSHPGFLLGLALITIYLLSSIIEFIFLKADNNSENKIHKKEQISTLLSILILNLLATFCTPYGVRLYFYIFDYLFKSHAIIAVTDEFQSPIFHGALQTGNIRNIFCSHYSGFDCQQKQNHSTRINKLLDVCPSQFIGTAQYGFICNR